MNTKLGDNMDSEFIIKFDGQQNQIDADVLINNLIHTSTIIQELNKGLDSGKKIDIKIKALEKGSFKLHIDLIETILPVVTMLSVVDMNYTVTIIEGFIGLIKLKLFLKDEEPKEVIYNEINTTIERNDGTSMTFNNSTVSVYLNNPVVDQALAKSFESIENDPSITAYEITDVKDKPKLIVDREEFKYLSTSSKIIYKEERLIRDIDARLHVVRVSFDKNLKWEFFYNGNKITAKLDDPSFQTRIDGGESFAKGDVLIVVLEIKQKFDTSANTFVNISYRVVEIIDHLEREKPPQLF